LFLLFVPNFGSLVFSIKFEGPLTIHIKNVSQSELACSMGGYGNIEPICTHKYYYMTMFLRGSPVLL
jgi:hypothetical protein